MSDKYENYIVNSFIAASDADGLGVTLSWKLNKENSEGQLITIEPTPTPAYYVLAYVYDAETQPPLIVNPEATTEYSLSLIHI